MLEILERAQSCSLTDMEKEILAFLFRTLAMQFI